MDRRYESRVREGPITAKGRRKRKKTIGKPNTTKDISQSIWLYRSKGCRYQRKWDKRINKINVWLLLRGVLTRSRLNRKYLYSIQIMFCYCRRACVVLPALKRHIIIIQLPNALKRTCEWIKKYIYFVRFMLKKDRGFKMPLRRVSLQTWGLAALRQRKGGYWHHRRNSSPMHIGNGPILTIVYSPGSLFPQILNR